MSKVSIVVTAFLEQSRPYLDLCIKSLKNLSHLDFEIIIVSPKGYEHNYEGVRVVHPEKEPYYNAHALNVGAKASDPTSEYFLFLNDDVILTRECLTNLIGSSKQLGDSCITMPIGNDQQRSYWLPIPLVSPVPYKIEQVEDHEHFMLMNAESYFKSGMIFPEVLCLYAVLVPRRVFEIVGEFDDSRLGQDDVDFSRRVKLNGFLNVIALNSLCWHAGGVSADITMGDLTSQVRAESLASYNKKWGDNNGATKS